MIHFIKFSRLANTIERIKEDALSFTKNYLWVLQFLISSPCIKLSCKINISATFSPTPCPYRKLSRTFLSADNISIFDVEIISKWALSSQYYNKKGRFCKAGTTKAFCEKLRENIRRNSNYAEVFTVERFCRNYKLCGLRMEKLAKLLENAQG